MDISVIITAHSEGRLAHHTMKSVLGAMDRASGEGLSCEALVMLDNPTPETIAYFERYKDEPRVRMEQTSFADPGPARNRGVEQAKGEWIALLDADDAFGSQWLARAGKAARAKGVPVVLYPEYFVFFEDAHYVVRSNSTQDAGFDASRLMQYNFWNSVHFMTQRSTLIDIPFLATPRDSGLGYEDWHWFSEVVARGIPVERVSETVVFYRKKRAAASRLGFHMNESVLIPPTSLFAYPADDAQFERRFGARYGEERP